MEPQRTQPPTDAQQTAAETELQLARDVEVIRRSLQQHEEGDTMEVNAFFAQMRADRADAADTNA